jgi:hypothetical protein
MTGALVKGALVQYPPTTGTPAPVITVFQYNPESMVHTWTQAPPSGQPGVEAGNPMAVPGMPGETFQFTIFLDSDDDIVSGVPRLAQSALDSGVGSRLAALELLLYPTASAQAAGGQPGATSSGSNSTSMVGTVTAASGSSGGSQSTWSLPNSTVPVVLFVWGANRIVPVRVTGLTITETLYDTDLNPTHAQAQLTLRVLTPTELTAARPDAGTPADLATVAYNQTLATRRQWAASNTSNPPISITAMLPH